jgi:hypothetical protein
MADSDYLAFIRSVTRVAALPVQIFCAAHARKICYGVEENAALMQGVLDQLTYAREHTLDLLRQHGEMAIPQFKRQYPSRIWQYLEHPTVAFAVLKVLVAEGIVERVGKRFRITTQ